MDMCVLTLVYNEEKILPYFIKHYSQFCNRMIFYDNESTDRSVEIIKSFPNTEVRPNITNGQISDLRYLDIKNNMWKEYKFHCDYQIVVDIDEFIYHPNFIKEMEVYKTNGVTIIPSIGYNMISNYFPNDYSKQLYEHVKDGIPAPGYGKTCIFDPKQILEINYKPGAHLCSPFGHVTIGYPIFKLLHFKYFGYHHWKEKNDLYVSRLGETRDGYADAYLMWNKLIQNEKDYINHFELSTRFKVL